MEAIDYLPWQTISRVSERDQRDAETAVVLYYVVVMLHVSRAVCVCPFLLLLFSRAAMPGGGQPREREKEISRVCV